MTTTLTPSQQGEVSAFAAKYVAGLRRIADEVERMLTVEGCSSMELAGYLTGSTAEILKFCPWVVRDGPRFGTPP